MTYEAEFDNVAQEVLARVAAGESLTLRLCQQVIDERSSTARPSAVLFTTAGLLSERARGHRWAAS